MTGIVRGYLTIIVRPSTRAHLEPITAFISGTTIEGRGATVVEAIEDLFTTFGAGKMAAQLEAGGHNEER